MDIFSPRTAPFIAVPPLVPVHLQHCHNAGFNQDLLQFPDDSLLISFSGSVTESEDKESILSVSEVDRQTLGSMEQPPASVQSEPPSNGSVQPRKKRKYRSRVRARSPSTVVRIRKVRRTKANVRERTRMHTLNDGLEMLREVLPVVPEDNKLTKIETLRTALNYIKVLENILQLPENQNQELDLNGTNQMISAATFQSRQLHASEILSTHDFSPAPSSAGSCSFLPAASSSPASVGTIPHFEASQSQQHLVQSRQNFYHQVQHQDCGLDNPLVSVMSSGTTGSTPLLAGAFNPFNEVQGLKLDVHSYNYHPIDAAVHLDQSTNQQVAHDQLLNNSHFRPENAQWSELSNQIVPEYCQDFPASADISFTMQQSPQVPQHYSSTFHNLSVYDV